MAMQRRRTDDMYTPHWGPDNWLQRAFGPGLGVGFLGMDSSDLDHESDRMLSSTRGEIEETDKEINLKCVLPGVPRDDIKIDVQGNVLSMKVKRDQTENGKDDDTGMEWHRRQMQDVMKSWRLPKNTDPKNIKANTKHGILTITVPKVPPPKQETHKIEVQGE